MVGVVQTTTTTIPERTWLGLRTRTCQPSSAMKSASGAGLRRVYAPGVAATSNDPKIAPTSRATSVAPVGSAASSV